jgi:hypothetical protein
VQNTEELATEFTEYTEDINLGALSRAPFYSVALTYVKALESSDVAECPSVCSERPDHRNG